VENLHRNTVWGNPPCHVSLIQLCDLAPFGITFIGTGAPAARARGPGTRARGSRAIASDPGQFVEVKSSFFKCDRPGRGSRISDQGPGAGRGSARISDQGPGGSYLVPARRRPWDRGHGIAELGSRISDQAPAARRPAAGRGSATGDRGPGARARGHVAAIAFAYRRGPWPAHFTGRCRICLYL
jgi:hypothetical protein